MNWLALLAVLGACKGDRTSEPPVASPAPKPELPSIVRDAGLADAPGAIAFSTTIGDDGIGPIKAANEITVATLGKLVPGLDVASRAVGTQDEITLSYRSNRVLVLIVDRASDNKLVRMDVYDPMFATASGIGIGSLVKELDERHPEVRCQRAGGRIACATPKYKRLAFAVQDDARAPAASPAGAGSDELLDPDQLRNQAIVLISWQAL